MGEMNGGEAIERQIKRSECALQSAAMLDVEDQRCVFCGRAKLQLVENIEVCEQKMKCATAVGKKIAALLKIGRQN